MNYKTIRAFATGQLRRLGEIKCKITTELLIFVILGSITYCIAHHPVYSKSVFIESIFLSVLFASITITMWSLMMLLALLLIGKKQILEATTIYHTISKDVDIASSTMLFGFADGRVYFHGGIPKFSSDRRLIEIIVNDRLNAAPITAAWTSYYRFKQIRGEWRTRQRGNVEISRISSKNASSLFSGRFIPHSGRDEAIAKIRNVLTFCTINPLTLGTIVSSSIVCREFWPTITYAIDAVIVLLAAALLIFSKVYRLKKIKAFHASAKEERVV